MHLRRSRAFEGASGFSYFSWNPVELGVLNFLTDREFLRLSGNRKTTHFPARGDGFLISTDGKLVVFGDGKSLKFVDLATGVEIGKHSFTSDVQSFSWSPKAHALCVGFEDGSVQTVDPSYGTVAWAFPHASGVVVEWISSDELLTCGRDGTVAILKLKDGGTEFEEVRSFDIGAGIRTARKISETSFAVLGEELVVHAWRLTGEHEYSIEVASGISGFDVAPDGLLFACVDLQGDISFFDLEARELIETHPIGDVPMHLFAGFSGDSSKIAWIDWEGIVNIGAVPKREPTEFSSTSVRYRNAKVVLVGDSGVGKSGLALALTKEKFEATESTHARRIVTLKSSVSGETDLSSENREIMLWDLAGQPGYRSFHKLSLRDVAVGLIVFDARSESDPFRGVPYWARALDEASGKSAARKLLISARADRGGASASEDRIAKFCEKYGIENHVETSAKWGTGVDELSAEIDRLIDWESQPVIVAPQVLMQIRAFLIRQKQAGTLVVREGDLLSSLNSDGRDVLVSQNVFKACLERLEAAGLVTELVVRHEWLLQPELLDSYVAFLAQAARGEPDGLGQISETSALAGEYPRDEPLDPASERAMLMTAVNEVVGRSLALRVATDAGQMLVFPSERRTDMGEFPGGYDLSIEYRFAGDVAGIYAAVTVKLVNSPTSGLSREYTLYHNAAIFKMGKTGEAGISVGYTNAEDESEGRMVVFFSDDVTRESKLSFLRYIDFQLRQVAQPESIQRTRVYVCCGFEISHDVIATRTARGEATVLCSICELRTNMDDLVDQVQHPDQNTATRNLAAQRQQAIQTRLSVLEEREALGEADVFLCFNSLDLGIVIALRDQLRGQGLLAWVDKNALLGGDGHSSEIEKAIVTIPAIAVVVGPNSMGRWQEEEYSAALAQAVKTKRSDRPTRLIPVLAPGGPPADELPPFLGNRTAVDMRRGGFSPDNVKALADAILGYSHL